MLINTAADLKLIYRAAIVAAALEQLKTIGSAWDDKYPQTTKSWNANWENIATLFQYPSDIRKAIYTTNPIESFAGPNTF